MPRPPMPCHPPGPLEQVYPWKPRREPVTIAAGFLGNDGLLLCADTLYTDGYTKEYREKIFSWTRKNAAVCFALAGSDAVGRMTVEHCQWALEDSKRKTLSVRQAK